MTHRCWIRDNAFPDEDRPVTAHGRGGSLPRAIIEACVEALSDE